MKSAFEAGQAAGRQWAEQASDRQLQEMVRHFGDRVTDEELGSGFLLAALEYHEARQLARRMERRPVARR